ncbi:MAG: Rpn family recombination-promoting nuclease/putative transposase [Anaerolineae bacterium]|nr:Rpn family recombination-promoting nuclease/putative transposase [Anaerolineae bacterium]
MSVHNPHDRFFRESFSRPEIVRNYLEEYLPADLLALLDPDTLILGVSWRKGVACAH